MTALNQAITLLSDTSQLGSYIFSVGLFLPVLLVLVAIFSCMSPSCSLPWIVLAKMSEGAIELYRRALVNSNIM